MSKNDFGSIQKEIKEIQSNSPPCAEGLIRSIDKMVKSHRDKEEKKILEMKLKKAAIHGLHKELQKAMTLNGLELEALPLVREHLTTKTALASFFADTPDGNLTKDMKMVRRKLGETLETQCQSSQFKSIKEQIEKVPSDDHISTATLIREINDMVTDLPNDKEKKALQSSLKRKALWGLSEDLQKLMESRGLAHECLPLVLRHLTTKRDLAVFLYENNKDDDGLQEFETIRRKVGQELEAFGEPETNFESPQFKSIKEKLEELTKDDHTSNEALIREIDEMVSELPESREKKELSISLKKKASSGLSNDLQELMKSRGLANDCLPLVLKHLTTKPDLAKFLYENKDDKDLEMIRRKVGQDLEVLGELVHLGFDASSNSVQGLIKEAPSRSRLERMEVGELKKLDFSPEDANFINEKVKKEGKTATSKETDEEKREKAEALRDIASNMAAENMKEVGTDVKGKIADLRENLKNRPIDWNQHDKKSPNEMLNYIKQEDIGEVKVADSSSADIKAIVARSSGGLALKGIYYPRRGQPEIADLPILKPPCDVCSWNTQSPYETGFRQFSDGNTAATFSKEVENSGFTHADSVHGFYGTLAAKANVAFGEESSDEKEKSSKTCTTSVSATKFCRCATRCFAIPIEHMELCDQACNMASELCKDGDTEKREKVLRFFKIYGSHIPFGVHQLGGLFFTISTATSETEMNVSTLMNLNAKKLNTAVSAGFYGGVWGIGASDQHSQESSEGSTSASDVGQEKVSYTFSVKSIGPQADNLKDFKEAIINKDKTWAVLDRGDISINVPVWKLLKEKDSEKFQEVAELMEDIWKEEEGRKKDKAQKPEEKTEEDKKLEREALKMKEKQKAEVEVKKMQENVEREIKRQFQLYSLFSKPGEMPPTIAPFRGTIEEGAKSVFLQYFSRKKDIGECEKVMVQSISKDPEQCICQIFHSVKIKDKDIFGLIVFKAEDNFKVDRDGHSCNGLLFFSDTYFKFREQLQIDLSSIRKEVLGINIQDEMVIAALKNAGLPFLIPLKTH